MGFLNGRIGEGSCDELGKLFSTRLDPDLRFRRSLFKIMLRSLVCLIALSVAQSAVIAADDTKVPFRIFHQNIRISV